MTFKNRYIEIHRKVENLIDDSNLYQAISLLRKNINLPELAFDRKKLDKIEETYKFLLSFYIKNIPDDNREENILKLKSELIELNDAILKYYDIKESPLSYSAAKRFENIQNSSLFFRLQEYKDSLQTITEADSENIDFRRQNELALSNLFNYIWTMHGSSKEDYNLLKQELLENNSLELKSQIISAILLGNLNYYDKNALVLLLDIYESAIDVSVQAKALVAITFILIHHYDKIIRDNILTKRLSLWHDSSLEKSRIKNIIFNIIRTNETQRISFKVQNEVMPELFKLKPDILEKLKGFSNNDESEEGESNPDWEELLENSSLGEKLRELSEIQMEGGDFMMLAFSNLKDFSFFRNVSNWFLPFNISHSQINENGNISDEFKKIFEIDDIICDSDKYSFALSLQRMPESQKNILSSRMGEQLEQLKEIIEEKESKITEPDFNKTTKLYIRNIYRFFQLYYKKREFKDPFASSEYFKNPLLSFVLNNEDTALLLAEFYLKNNFFNESLQAYIVADNFNGANPVVWEKIGYCHEKLNNIKDALVWYKKAELLKPESKWLIKRIAMLLKNSGEYKEAYEYYDRLNREIPDNVTNLMNLGLCLMQLNKYKEALSHFYHAEYLNPDKKDIRRAIAWLELFDKNYDKSLSYYSKIINEGEVKSEDYLNLAYLYFIQGNRGEAFYSLKKSLSLEAGNYNSLKEMIRKDEEALKKIGINPSEFNLLTEALKYND